MTTEVRITQAQAQQHQADLFAAIGATPRAEGFVSRRVRQAHGRGRVRLATFLRRAAAA